MDTIRAGIIGCGTIYKMHARSIKQIDNIYLSAVCDIAEVRAKTAAVEFGCTYYTDYKTMIEKENLDTVHICLPHYLHKEATVYALEHGVDVLCEKPMSIEYSDAEKMLGTAEKYGRKLGVVFQNRLNAGSVFVKDYLTEGKLGAVLGAKCSLTWHRDASYYVSGDWRGKIASEGGGVVINQAIHTLDLMRWLVNLDVSEVMASTSRMGNADIEAEDTANGVITFKNGAQGIFSFSNNYCKDSPASIEVVCEKGSAVLEGDTGKILLNGNVIISDCNYGYNGIPPECFKVEKSAWGNSHFRQIARFYSDTSGEITRNDLTEAIKTQRLVCAIYDSARNNKKIYL